jgi:hypothetical protein
MINEDLKKIIPEFPKVIRDRAHQQLSLRYKFDFHIVEGESQRITFPRNTDSGYYLSTGSLFENVQNGEWNCYPTIILKEKKQGSKYLDIINYDLTKKISDHLLLSMKSEEDEKRKWYTELNNIGDKIVEIEEGYLIQLLSAAAMKVKCNTNVTISNYIDEAYGKFDHIPSGKPDTLLVSPNVEGLLRNEDLMNSNTNPGNHNLGIVRGLNTSWVSGIPRNEFFISDIKNAGIFLIGEFSSEETIKYKQEGIDIVSDRYLVELYRSKGNQYLKVMWRFSALTFKDYGIIKYILPKDYSIKKTLVTSRRRGENGKMGFQNCFIRAGGEFPCNKALHSNKKIAFMISSSDIEFIEEIEYIKKYLQRKYDIKGYFASDDPISDQEILCQRICSKIIESRFCIVILNPPKHRSFIKKFDEQFNNLDNTMHEFIEDNSRIPNPNVYWEYGIAKALNKKCIVFCREDLEPAWDVDKISHIKYTKTDLSEKFDFAIDACVKATK